MTLFLFPKFAFPNPKVGVMGLGALIFLSGTSSGGVDIIDWVARRGSRRLFRRRGSEDLRIGEEEFVEFVYPV